MMKTNHGKLARKTLGEIVAAACDRGSTLGPDAAGELAARHLERVLVRGSNARLIAALTDLARELRPTRSAAELPFRGTPALAGARP